MPNTEKGPGQGAPANSTSAGQSNFPDLESVLDELRSRGHKVSQNAEYWFVGCPTHPFNVPGVRINEKDGAYVWRCLTLTSGETRCTPDEVITSLGIRDLFPKPEDQVNEAAVDALLAEMLSGNDLDQIPDPEPLVDGVFDLDTLSWIIGRSGNGKTFVTIDICGSIATGKPWHGHKVVQGPVVYLAAEGARGFKKRIRAWEKHHHRTMGDNLRVLPRPVLVNDAEWTTLIEACRRIKPVLIVIDTMARVSAGMEENSSKDMGILVHQSERLREACGGCVALVHHQGHKGENGRGSSALIGAMNTEIRVSMDKKTRIVTVENSKQKDEAEGDDLKFLLTPVNLGVDASGRFMNSAVLVETSDFTSEDLEDPNGLSGQPALLVGLMTEHFPHRVGTKAELARLAKERHEIGNSSFYKAWKRLVEEGVVTEVKGAKFRLVPMEERFPR